MIRLTIILLTILVSGQVFSANQVQVQKKYFNSSSVMPFLDYVDSHPIGDYKIPKIDLIKIIDRGWNRDKRISLNGPTSEDFINSVNNEKAQSETGENSMCVRTMTMTNYGFLNIRECLNRKVSLAEAAEWFHYYSNKFISSIDHPGRFITYGQQGELVGLYYSVADLTVNEVVFFSTSLK